LNDQGLKTAVNFEPEPLKARCASLGSISLDAFCRSAGSNPAHPDVPDNKLLMSNDGLRTLKVITKVISRSSNPPQKLSQSGFASVSGRCYGVTLKKGRLIYTYLPSRGRLVGREFH